MPRTSDSDVTEPTSASVADPRPGPALEETTIAPDEATAIEPSQDLTEHEQAEAERAAVVAAAVEAKNEELAAAASVQDAPEESPPAYNVSLHEDAELETPLRVQVAGLEAIELESQSATVQVEAERANVLASVPYLTVEVAE